MRVKFSSRRTCVGASETRTRATTTTSTPIFNTYFITAWLVFCTTCWTSTCAQRVFWMYSPLPQITGFTGYNGDDNSAAAVQKSVLMLLPIYHNKNDQSQYQEEYKPAVYQRSIMGYNDHVPVITPLVVEQGQHGSVSSWPGEKYYKRNEKIRRRNHVESVFLNQNILDMGERDGDHENDNSGSTEEASFITQLYDDRDVAYDAAAEAEAIILDKRVVRQKCRLEGDLARYDPVTGACYTIGTKGPCGDFMMFTAVPGDNFNGQCDCDYDSFDRPLIRVGDQCHFLYTQAICYPGYWLTGITPNYEATCEQNPCYHPRMPLSSSEPSKNSVVLFKGECVNLNSSSSHCRREGEVVLFPKGSVEPACGFPKSTRRIFRRQISNVTRFACRPGMRRHRVTKKCVRSRSIVFSTRGF